MSEGLNRVQLLGYLGADPELRVTSGGQAVCNIRLATNESWVDRSNQRQERTEWHRVTIWGRRGEGLAKILTKGSQIYIDGKLQTTSYEKDGEKKYVTNIVATSVLLCGGGGRREERKEERREERAPGPEVPADDAQAAADDENIPF